MLSSRENGRGGAALIIVGERLNSSRGVVLEALQKKDTEYLCGQALAQEKAGASFIDLNAATMMDKEIEAICWAVPLIQRAVKTPLALDTPNPDAMEAAIKIHQGRALLNSLSGERAALDALLPLIKRYRPRVIALCLDKDGPPENADAAVSRARRMADILQSAGLHLEDIFIDPLVRPIGIDHNSGMVFLESVARIKSSLPGIKTIAGVSNVSFGLPQRRLLNRTLLILAMAKGLDAAICDPLDGDIQALLAASEALLGRDPSLKKYLSYIREQAKKSGA
jgi:5-methyltetrahydrofolate--homocysteine methyltransferase